MLRRGIKEGTEKVAKEGAEKVATTVVTRAGAEIRAMALKGWSKGKGAVHFEKHGKTLGFKNVKEYTDAAIALAAKTKNVIESKVGNIIFKFDKDTNMILIINAKDRTIKTFYKAEKGLQSFKDAMMEHYKVMKNMGGS